MPFVAVQRRGRFADRADHPHLACGCAADDPALPVVAPTEQDADVCMTLRPDSSERCLQGRVSPTASPRGVPPGRVPGAIADTAVVRAAFGAVAQIGVAVPYGSP